MVFAYNQFNMGSYWPLLCRIVDGIEGTTGVLLNICVICILFRRKLADNLITYRVCITTTALQCALVVALIPLFCMTVHMCRENRFVTTFFGLVTLLPPSYCNICLALYIFIGSSTWNSIPAASILQYLALCRSNCSTIQRLVIAYGPCLMLQLWIFPYCSTFPTSLDRQQMFLKDAVEVYNLTETERYVVIGGLLEETPENPVSMWKILVEGIMPTYSIAYLMFACASIAVYRELSRFGVQLSSKTAMMQRRFLITLVLQGLLPLAAISIPISFLAFGLLSGRELTKLTSLIGFSYYTIPIIQGCISLSFVARGLRSSLVASSRESKTRRT